MHLSEYQAKLKTLLENLQGEEEKAALRYLCRTDLYYLLRYALKKSYIEHPWLFERCREVESEPYGTLDVWAREHCKSTIITVGKNIQDILASHGKDPLPRFNGQEATIGIFSHTRGIAKGFLREIKREFEENQLLKDLFPDILYQNPDKESPKWSEDDGIIVKRQTKQKESTVEAWGLVDGMPTSKHFLILNYDDVVTDKSVTSEDMIKKTTDALGLSYNLGARGGFKRVIGTYYHFNDTLRQLVKQGKYKIREYPATDTGKIDGKPVLLTEKQYKEKREEAISSYVFACQILLNPVADDAQGFNEEWIRFCGYQDGRDMNIYLLVDPASSKKKSSDYTVMVVIGLGKDGNYYLLDGIRDRLNLAERWRWLKKLHEDWVPQRVGYERYGMQADIEYFKEKMEREKYRFDIIELGGQMAKEDRIRRLVGPFENGKFYLPNHIRKVDYEKNGYDLTEKTVIELKEFPVSEHDDILDSMSRIKDPDLGAKFPRLKPAAAMAAKQVQSGYNPLNW